MVVPELNTWASSAQTTVAPHIGGGDNRAVLPANVDVDGIWRAMIDALPLPVVVHDQQGRVAYANQAFADLLGYRLTDVLAMSADNLIHPDDRRARDELATRLGSGELDQAQTDRRLLSSSGHTLLVHTHKAALTVGERRLVMVCIQNVGHWHTQIDQLSHLAAHDELTGCFNRAGLTIQLNRLLTDGRSGRVALIDLNALKRINDIHGHAAGDELLRATAGQLQAADPQWTVGRWGGDEFVVAASDTASLRPAIEAALDIHIAIAGHRVAVTAAIGETQFSFADTLVATIDRADLDMYRHKR